MYKLLQVKLKQKDAELKQKDAESQKIIATEVQQAVHEEQQKSNVHIHQLTLEYRRAYTALHEDLQIKDQEFQLVLATLEAERLQKSGIENQLMVYMQMEQQIRRKPNKRTSYNPPLKSMDSLNVKRNDLLLQILQWKLSECILLFLLLLLSLKQIMLKCIKIRVLLVERVFGKESSMNLRVCI